MLISRLLVVDDEEEVRLSIIKKIKWNEMGFELVGDAENGKEAFDMIESVEPDVILTDIRMPFMDGLELIEKVYRSYPTIKIIVFSGYDEFEYAQKAIKYNVIGYILKPVNMEELIEILVKMKNSIEEEIAEKRNVVLLKDKLKTSLPVAKDHFLNNLIRGAIECSKIPVLIDYYDIPIRNAREWVVVSVQMNKPTEVESPFHQDDEILMISLSHLMDEILRENYRFTTLRVTTGLCAIVAIDHNNTVMELIDLMRDYTRNCKKILGLFVVVGLGNTKERLEDIHISYKESKEAIGYQAISEVNDVIYYRDVEPPTNLQLLFDHKTDSELERVIKFGSNEELNQMIAAFMEQMEGLNTHSYQYQAHVVYLFNLVTQLQLRYNIEFASILDNQADCFELLTNLRSPKSIRNWLMKTCNHLREVINDQRSNTAKELITKSLKYISDNYMNPEISCESISQLLHISPAYFSTIFKKETGSSYVEYLTDLRLSKAVELLRRTDDKTYVIANRVGYLEPNYFSYVFKKKYGISPSNYRGKMEYAQVCQ